MQPSTRTQLRALAFGALFLVIGGSCTQPKMNCTTAHLPYAAKYTLTSGDKNSPCGQLTGDILGMQTYFATGGINGTAKFDEPSAAIRAKTAGLLIAEAQDYPLEVPGFTGVKGVEHWPNALGDFESGFPDDEDFCHVEKLGPAVIDRPELPGYTIEDDPDTDENEMMVVPATPPVSVRYEWTNARWLDNPDAQGTQFEADLKYTQDGCTAEYHVVGVSPSVACLTDDDCNAVGNGINPDFAVRCDTSVKDPGVVDKPETPEDETAWGLCILAKEIPSYK